MVVVGDLLVRMTLHARTDEMSEIRHDAAAEPASSLRVARLVCILSLFPAALGALQAMTREMSRADLEASWPEVVFQTVDWYTLGVATILTYTIARRTPIGAGRWMRAIAVHATGAIVFWLVWGFVCVAAGRGVSAWFAAPSDGTPNGRTTFFHAPLRRELNWVLTNLPVAILVYSTAAGACYAYTYFQQARAREQHALRLDAQLSEARLRALRMQLNPHFLFNSLNAILTLVREGDMWTAERTLELLGDVLRQTLRPGERHEIRLADELAFVRRYLAIEQVRFGDALIVDWSIDNQVRDAPVPEFILQPLVENAIRHGLSRRMGARRIAVSATVHDGWLRISIRDDGPGLAQSGRQPEGIGLSNTRARLSALYGEAGTVELRSSPDGPGAEAVITLPLRELAS